MPDHDCEALVQDAVFSYLTSGPPDNPRAWLVAAVCNASRHYWRQRVRTSDLEGARLDEVEGPPDGMDIDRMERSILVRGLLARLRPRDRDVLRLHYFEGRTATEIADILETTARYAEKLIWKALTHARDEYDRLNAVGVPRVRTAATSKPRTADDSAATGLTRVQVFMRTHGISDVELSVASGLRQSQLDCVLRGVMAGRGRRVRVLGAIRRITGRDVQMDELFDARSDDDAA